MKRILILIFTLLGTLSLSAQRVDVGARAPRIRGVEWISDEPEKSKRALMVEFFHSSNEDCREHIDHLNALASDYRHEMDVVMLTREPAEQVAYMLLHEYQFFYVATDESGDMFRSFGVSHVPFAVIINPKGTIVWMGNPLTLNNKTLKKLLQ
ncbi:MAG: TlpA family protein disulfide reductase [Tidjanibacter sp.]|nr:TlpA family protein disulfide reductase [Tidjanibacter sp.]